MVITAFRKKLGQVFESPYYTTDNDNSSDQKYIAAATSPLLGAINGRSRAIVTP